MVTREGGADAQESVRPARWQLRGILALALATLVTSLFIAWRVTMTEQTPPTAASHATLEAAVPTRDGGSIKVVGTVYALPGESDADHAARARRKLEALIREAQKE